jgi:hypothetical protein
MSKNAIPIVVKINFGQNKKSVKRKIKYNAIIITELELDIIKGCILNPLIKWTIERIIKNNDAVKQVIIIK